MRGFERLCDLLGDGQSFVKRDRSPFDPISQRWAFDEFEDERPRVAGFLQPVDRTNVGMVE